MSTSVTRPTPGRANLALATLFLAMFVLGSAELLVVGLLDLIASDLRISIPTAGALVTAYALGLAIGGPLLTALTIKLNRRTVIALALALYLVGNLIAVLTSTYGLFLTARAISGAVHGLFIAGAFAAAMAVVPPERVGRAIAVVISGVSVSAAFGVPLGTLAGHGLGWRNAFVAVVVLTALSLVATLATIPSTPSAGGSAGSQARHAFAPRVLAVLALCILAFAGVNAVLTYIVPFLQEVTGIAGATVSVFLLAYGVATAIGSIGGGRFADHNAGRALNIASIGAAAALLLLYLVGSSPALVAVVMLIWGIFAFAMAPSLQYRIVSLAGPGAGLAQSLPASAINIGIALGSLAGGLAIRGQGTSAAVVTGLIIAVTAIPVAWATSLLKPPATEPAHPDASMPATEAA